MKLKNLFFVDETAPKESAKSTPTPTTTPSQATVSIPSTATAQVFGAVNESMLALLDQAIANANLPGQDYFEFNKALQAMSSLQMDEKTKFISVFSVLSQQGCTKEILVKSIDTYIKVIDGEKINFDKEMEKENNSRVKSKEKIVADSKEELERLTKRISELNQTILNVSQEIQQEDFKIKQTASNFEITLNTVKNRLSNDKEKITQYL